MKVHEPIPERDEELANAVIGAAIEVHRILGPGFMEAIYRKALAHELGLRGVLWEEEKWIAVPYKDTMIPGQRLDLLVGERVVIELKCVEEFAPIHLAKVMSYLKATRLRLGLLINFKVTMLRDGIKRVVL
jgi:GxxExxY protein